MSGCEVRITLRANSVLLPKKKSQDSFGIPSSQVPGINQNKRRFHPLTGMHVGEVVSAHQLF